MSICNFLDAISPIDLDECVGTSLNTINYNFFKLQEQLCTDKTKLETLQQELLTLSAGYIDLQTKSPGFAKAWVVFNGSNGNRFASNNISQVTRDSTGQYTLTFSKTLTGYALVGTSSSVKTNTNYTWLQPVSLNNTSATININDYTGTFADPEYVSIAIYSV
jgi:hypothetical protein